MPRITKQKRLLNEEVDKMNYLFSAYDLHNNISKKTKDIGLATVYRFLNKLESENLIHSFMCDNKKIYSSNKVSHAHFKCEKCSKIKHIKIKNLDFLSDFVNESICHFQIELTGVCSDCK